MEDNFHGSFRIYVDAGNNPDGSNEEFQSTHGGSGSSHVDAKMAFERDVEVVKEDIENLGVLYNGLIESHEEMKGVRNAATAAELRAQINRDLEKITKQAKQISRKVDGLVLTSAGLRMIPGSGLGSEEDQARTAAIRGLEELVYELMRRFQRMRMQMEAEHRQVIHNRFLSVAGQKMTAEENIEKVISSSVPEIALRESIEQLGRETVMDTVNEIRERRDTMIELRAGLMNLHQVLLGVAGSVESRMRPSSPRENSELLKMAEQVVDPTTPLGPTEEDIDIMEAQLPPRKFEKVIQLLKLTGPDNRVSRPKAAGLLLLAVAALFLIIYFTLKKDDQEENRRMDLVLDQIERSLKLI